MCPNEVDVASWPPPLHRLQVRRPRPSPRIAAVKRTVLLTITIPTMTILLARIMAMINSIVETCQSPLLIALASLRASSLTPRSDESANLSARRGLYS